MVPVKPDPGPGPTRSAGAALTGASVGLPLSPKAVTKSHRSDPALLSLASISKMSIRRLSIGKATPPELEEMEDVVRASPIRPRFRGALEMTTSDSTLPPKIAESLGVPSPLKAV